MDIKTTDVLYICGKRGYGKSFFLDFVLRKVKRYVLYDSATFQHGKMGVIVKDVKTLSKIIYKYDKIVFQSDIDNIDIFNDVCEIVWKKGNIVFAVEELGNYCTAYNTAKNFDKLVRVGRNRGIGIYAVNQRAKRVWTNFIFLIDKWIIFRQDYPSDLNFLKEYVGEKFISYVKVMPKYYFLYKDNEKVKIMKPISIK